MWERIKNAAKSGGIANPLNWEWGQGVRSAGNSTFGRAVGIDNLGRAFGELGRGSVEGGTRWLDVARNLGQGALELGSAIVPGMAGARAARLAGTGVIGRGAGFTNVIRQLPTAFRGAFFTDPLKAARTMQGTSAGARALRGVAGIPGLPLFTGSLLGNIGFDLATRRAFADSAAPTATGGVIAGALPAGAAGGPPDIYGTNTSGAGVGGGGGGVGVSGGGSYIGGSGVSPDIGTQLPLSPAEQAMFDQARSEALRQFNLGRSAIDLERRGGSLSAQEAMREAGRMGATQGADLAAIASETGFASSPAAYGVGMSEIAQEEARRRMAAQSQYRTLQADLRQRAAEQQMQYDNMLAQLAIQEAQARAARGVSNVQGRYGI